MPTIQQANIEGKLLRSHLAKMLSVYATKVLEKTPDTTTKCSFTDMKNQSKERVNAAKEFPHPYLGHNVDIYV